MKKQFEIYYLILLFYFLSCDPHTASDHPCNFPDADTENNLRLPWTYKVIDGKTNINLVDTANNEKIHPDSVELYDESFNIIQNRYEYDIDNWIFTNFEAYKDIPYNDPQALLDLDNRIFYLKVSSNDIDTIKVFYDQCLISSVLYNGKDTSTPINEPYQGRTSLYFKK